MSEIEQQQPAGESIPSFRELVVWAEKHLLEGIGKNAYQHAVWTACERVAKWRFDQDAANVG